jgi:hypothetical protein
LSENKSIITIITDHWCYDIAWLNKRITSSTTGSLCTQIIKVIYPHERIVIEARAWVRVSEESPPDEKEHDESNAGKRTILEIVSRSHFTLFDNV